MNDYWNDPPEYPDPPSCPNDKWKCDGSGEYLYDGKTGMVFSCDVCAYQWVIPFDRDPEPDTSDRLIEDHIEHETTCPHGNELGECGTCDHLGDLAFDSAREQRLKH